MVVDERSFIQTCSEEICYGYLCVLRVSSQTLSAICTNKASHSTSYVWFKGSRTCGTKDAHVMRHNKVGSNLPSLGNDTLARR